MRYLKSCRNSDCLGIILCHWWLLYSKVTAALRLHDGFRITQRWVIEVTLQPYCTLSNHCLFVIKTAPNPSIQEVQTALWSARAKWFNMGLFFGVEHGTLEVIRGHRTNPDDCFRHMLGRVKNGLRNLTWENICKCLWEPTIEFAALADDLQAKYMEEGIQTAQKDRINIYVHNITL